MVFGFYREYTDKNFDSKGINGWIANCIYCNFIKQEFENLQDLVPLLAFIHLSFHNVLKSKSVVCIRTTLHVRYE